MRDPHGAQRSAAALRGDSPPRANLPAPAPGAEPSAPSRLLRGLALRSGQGRLRPAWAAAHAALLRLVVAVLRRGTPAAAVYARGGFGRDADPVYGLSDIDLLVVLPGDAARPRAARGRTLGRWRRLTRRLPALRRLVAVGAFEDAELADAAAASVLTHGLEPRGSRPGRALFYGSDPLRDHFSFRSRPGLYGPTADWRRLAGPERRPDRARPRRDSATAWLELQCWWRYAARACARPADLHTAYLGVKLIAEPVRILLWLRHGERVHSRPRALRGGLDLLPDAEAEIRLGLALHRALARRPDPALDRVLPALLSLSARVVVEIERALAGAPTHEVALVGEAQVEPSEPPAEAITWRRFGGAELLPLADWRALALAEPPAEALVVLRRTDAADPGVLAAAARAEAPGAAPALPWGPLLVMPSLDTLTRPLPRGVLRSVACAGSDPVTFALLSGRTVARFPAVAGWSAHDTSRRALAEQRARISTGSAHGRECELGALLAAARAALFADGVARGDPRLALTPAAAGDELGRRLPGSAGPAAEAAAAWREGARPDPAVVRAFADAVWSLIP